MIDNLIVVYNNVADTATLGASSTSAGDVNNLKNNIKSKIWRSSGSSATITASFASQPIRAVALAFCNLSSSATITINGITEQACPWDSPIITSPTGTVSSYAYGAGKLARFYFRDGPVTTGSLSISISNSGPIEVSRLIIGDAWSPKYNTSYGMSVEHVDLSTNERTDAGDLISNIGTKHAKMTFDLKYMTDADRTDMINLVKTVGTSKPIFVSLFPYNTESTTKERDYQIFGKVSGSSPVTHPFHSMYSSQLTIEEI